MSYVTKSVNAYEYILPILHPLYYRNVLFWHLLTQWLNKKWLLYINLWARVC